MTERRKRFGRLRAFVRRTRRPALILFALYLVLGFFSNRIRRAPETQTPTVVEPWSGDRPQAIGALSVHSGRSHDAKGTLEEVAEAAAEAGLDFVVLGDHGGDWTAPGAEAVAPRVVDDVLLVPGLEIAMAGIGRTLSVGMDTLPRRWEGDVASWVDRIHPTEGFTSVVHPRSPKSNEDWEGLEAPGIHAWESFDVSEMARTRAAGPWVLYHVGALVSTGVVGQGHRGLAGLWREGSMTPALAGYDSLRALGPVTLTGGLNVHPKFRLGPILIPGYRAYFRTVANHVVLNGPLPADAAQARDRLLAALRAGRLFVTLGQGGDPSDFGFRGLTGGGEVDEVVVGAGAATGFGVDARLEVRIPEEIRGRPLVRILKDGATAAWLEAEAGTALSWPVPEPGVYRVEIHRTGPRLAGLAWGFVPWIISNPVEFYRAVP